MSDTLSITLFPDPTHQTLQSLHLHLQSLLAPTLSSHLFHPHLSLHCPPNCHVTLPHLHVTLPFKDNLDDEWLLTSLIFTFTQSIPNLTAHIVDNDGQFLLIEAAFSLPKFLTPQSAHNRVFVRNAHLHIISPQHLTLNLDINPSLEEALAIIRDPRIDTRAPQKVQDAVMMKISQYPVKALKNRHVARVRVPLNVGKVLKLEPCLVGLAVEAFYERGVEGMRDAMRMERFLDGGGGEEIMVRVGVGLTRVLYGQLVQQRFEAPRGYPMPGREEGGAAWAEAELGMKIACGFEMVYWARKRAGEEGKGSSWEAFRESMERSGCFDGLLPGSKEYNRVLSNAEEYYRSTSLFSRTRYCCLSRCFFAFVVVLFMLKKLL